MDERRQIAPGSPPLRLELLHAQSLASLVTAVDLVQANKTSDSDVDLCKPGSEHLR